MNRGRTRASAQGAAGRGAPFALSAIFFIAALGFTMRTIWEYGWEFDRHPWNQESSEGTEPSFYYIDWSDDFEDPAELANVTSDGVLRTVRAQPSNDGGWDYDPIGVVQGGLALADQVLSGVDDADHRRSLLLEQADWLHESALYLPDSSAVWTVPWTAHTYGLEAPWISGIAQGQALSLLVRTAQYDRPQDLDLARAAARSLLTPRWSLQSGEPGHRFFEEYPSSPPSSVLNGSLFAWLGLWDLYRATRDPEIRDIALARLQEIEAVVPVFETDGGWTRYDRVRKRRASPSYQELHASLAWAIAAETGRSFWTEKAKTWGAAGRNPVQRVRTFFQVAWCKVTGDEAEVTPIPLRLDPAG